ncbi:helix-turn-helix transcriptional regulator [Vibrio parahaemolyticus]|nr:helix-turn-helix transcriptional regulator [Vibrio parahaemolyticus]
MFSNREALRSYRGDKLRLARLAQGFSLEELGELLAVTRQNVHKMEAGQEPTEEQLPILCKHLDVKKRIFL